MVIQTKIEDSAASNRCQIGSLIVTNPDWLKHVRTVVWNKRTRVLTAVAVTPQGTEQQYIHFLEPGPDEGPPRESHKTATDVDEEDCRAFIQAVEQEGGHDLSVNPAHNKNDANILVWESTAPDPPCSGNTPPPISMNSEIE
jgi:hypothetical protein